jgi:nitrogen fixation NifU-like protein|tara:strand:- start:273 stop:671 length:399 start_codon:yes stop_codon:yes gene_type:complete
MDLRILEIASHTENNKIIEDFTHKSKHKNPLCGDEMEISLIVKDNVIKDMGYQCKSCVYCQASVSLLSRKIKNQKIEEIKRFITNSEKLFDDVKINIEKHWKDFKEILDKKNLSRKECLLLPFKTILKALKI